MEESIMNETITMKERFENHLQSIGFDTQHDVLKTLHLVPSYYKNQDGDRILISDIHVAIFGGSNTKEGDLGCVVLSYYGKLKKKGKKIVDDNPEILKKVFVPHSAQEAIRIFDEWHNETKKIRLNEWKKIL
jgi:hypothetical protein